MGRGVDYRDSKWEGGYISPTSGKYIIHRKLHLDGEVKPRQFEVSTGQRDRSKALVELVRFEEDPAGYRAPLAGTRLAPGRAARTTAQDGVYMTKALVDEHMTWSTTTGRVTSKDWERAKRWLLYWWMEKLAGVNLRALPETMRVEPGQRPSPDGCDLGGHIMHALDEIDPRTGKPAGTRSKRIAEVKAFYAWLRTEKFLLRAHEDPTFGRLKGMKARVAQTVDFSKVIPFEHIKKVQAHWRSTGQALNQSKVTVLGRNDWKADILDLQMATAWHYAEVRRFCDPDEAASMLIVKGHPLYRPELEKDLPGGAVVAVRAKRKGLVYVRVTARGRAAAERLRAHGKLGDQHYFYDELKAASAAVKVPYFTPGRMRHTVLTWALERDAKKDVSTFAHHSSEATTDIYTLHSVPKKVWTRI